MSTKLEPKSIFTSAQDYNGRTASDREEVPSDPSTVLPSPNSIDREADAGPGAIQITADQATGQTETIVKDPVNASVVINAPSQSLPPSNNLLLPAPSFRKPKRPQNIALPSTPKLTHASKHARPEEHGSARHTPSSEPPLKRSRPRLRPRHILDPESFPVGFHRTITQPPSPLFFSHSPRPRRPILPPSYSSGEAAAAMLNKARDETAGGVTTLKLARGTLSTASPPHSSSSPGSWSSIEKTGLPRSPDSRGRQTGLQLLGNVGIIELLEQDERPTFIIDIANSVNFIPGGPLQIVFANASLRAYPGILDLVTGKPDLDSPGVAITNRLPEFKAWALSFVRNSESLDVCLPSFLYEGITWTCSTLRKRLRLISGTGSMIGAGTSSSSSTGGTSNFSMLVERTRNQSMTAAVPVLTPIPAELTEASDYFGLSRDRISEADESPLPLSSPGTADSMMSPLKQAMIATQPQALTVELLNTHYPEGSSFDWTRLPLSAAFPRHIQFARSVDWASTPLGPIEDWTFDLRAMCNLIMGSPHPAAMYWGSEHIAIYNEAYILLAGQKHPKLMGQSYKEAWKEIWPEIEDVFSGAMQSGQATMKVDDLLFMNRNGFQEETYFSWSIIPLVGEDGSVVGLYNPCFENTRRKVAERRMLTLREVGERVAAARDVKAFWGQVIKGLEYNDFDVPFVFLYSVSEDVDSEMSSMHSGSLSAAPQLVLEGSLGVPAGHRAAVSPLDLKTSDEGFAPYLRESMKTDRPVLLTTEEGTLSYDLIEGLEWRGFGDPCRAAVVCPIHPTTGESILGFLVMGVNPRRPYDDDYSLFIQLLSRQLATSMASAMLFEEEIRRGQRAARLAALDRQELSKQLDLRTQEAAESETKFTRMAEFAPVGMFIASSSGEITYSNDTWWEITRHPRAENSASTWMESIKEEDQEEVRIVWEKLVTRTTPVTHEFRFKTPWQDRNGCRGDTWVLMSAYPEKNADGRLKSVFGSITNISQQKWAEDFQKRRMEEAIELKRQQENFIDMTSHEMRNPLSAILQCADEISTSLSEYRTSEEMTKVSEKIADLFDSGIDAAQTISLCAQHQKRIVDDILTLSKLDSALLIVTPVSIQPIAVVQRALKMFDGELETNDIAMDFRMEKAYLDMHVDWVKLDPSRLLQVLINLITNAIKFTNGQDKRTIVVSISSSIERPSSIDSNVSYFPSRSKRSDHTTSDPEWGEGENIYLKFAVQDTGRGLDESERTLLFQRFRQASPRTHVQYGGSGLGLFISRELTELQGGEIGVSSERGVGSTFAFYVKARRVDDMPADTPVASSLNTLRRTSSSNNTSVTIESRRNSSGKAIYRSNTTGKRRPSSQTHPTPPLPSASTLDYSTLKVLIVEDNLVNQRVLQKQLKNIGFVTEVANHGGEALEVLKSSSFWKGQEKTGKELAIILMDLEMPVMDGLTCARTIRQLESEGIIGRHVPIIAVTANARMEQIESAISAGMDDVVSKPFRIPELIPKIMELVNKNTSSATWSSDINILPPKSAAEVASSTSP